MTEPIEEPPVLTHKPSVWVEIKSRLEPAEVPEVRAILGERLIEETELLHHETRSLVEILEEARLTGRTMPGSHKFASSAFIHRCAERLTVP